MENQTSGVNPQITNPEAYKAILAINEQSQELKAKESFWKAYLWSILMPPIGIYYFIKYFFFGTGSSNARKAAIISLVVTIVSLVLNIWFIKSLFSQSIPGGNQSLETINELITPENQKSLQQLLQ